MSEHEREMSGARPDEIAVASADAAAGIAGAVAKDMVAGIVALERAGKLAEAHELALDAARHAAARGDGPGIEARFLARASELALYTHGIEEAERLAEQACQRALAGTTAAGAGARETGATPGAVATPGGPGAVATPGGSEASGGIAAVATPGGSEAPGTIECLAEARLALARVCLRKHSDAALDQAEAALDSIAGAAELSAWHQATRLKLQGLARARRGQPRQALSCFAQAYDRAGGYPALRARILLAWAVQLRNWGAFDEARRKAERSLEIRLELDDHHGAAMCYGTLALIYQRQGMWQRERDALVADLRMCQRIGGTADVPGLHARLAGALIGLGKYAGAWAEAQAAITAENRRLGLPGPAEHAADHAGPDPALATRVHGFAWREMARVCLAQDRIDQGVDLVTRARSVFERLGDGYGQALCRLTEAQLVLDRLIKATAARDADGARATRQLLDEIIAAARPVFVRLGALPEAAEAMLIQAEAGALGDQVEDSADRIAQQVLPMLQQAGLGDSPLHTRARECLERMAPERTIERIVTHAAMLRTLAAIVTEAEPQPGTAVAVRAGEQAEARAFALSAVDRGAVVLWPDSQRCLAVVLGPGHEERAAELVRAAGAAPLVMASGIIDLEHMWPAGVRARGEPVDEALAGLARILAAPAAPAGPGGEQP
jgi:tetratricopeptide (TPR) repeat protein